MGNRCKIVKLANLKKFNWHMGKTPSKVHINDILEINTMVPFMTVRCLKYLGLDKVYI